MQDHDDLSAEASDLWSAVASAEGAGDEGMSVWASFDGLDIGPECQTPAEKRIAATRIVTAIETAVERMTEDGEDPSGPEAGLIEYAMRLRDRLRAQDAEPAESPAALPTPAGSPGPGTRLSVAITAAFLTGRPLQIQLGEYEGVQERLAERFKTTPGQGWVVTPSTWRDSATYNSGGGFTSMVPLVIASREGGDALARTTALLDEQPGPEREWLAEQTAGWVLHPDSMRVDVYDLGMGVMNGTFTMSAPADMSLEEIVRAVKRLVWLRPDPQAGFLSPIASVFRSIAAETAEQFSAAIDEAAAGNVDRAWLAPFLEAVATSTDTAPGEWGRLLWLHPVHVLTVEDSALIGDRASRMAPPFHRTLDVPDGRFVSGIGWSAIVTRPSPTDVDVTLRLIEMQWAYIALYMEIDRGLLALLNTGRSEHLTIPELEADAERAFADYMRVVEARARADSTLASLGGDEQTIWDTIADVTKLDALIAGVDRKVDALKQISDRRLQQAVAAQARRTSRILSGLTALTVITVAAALTATFLGSRSDAVGHIEIRLAVVALAVTAGIGWFRAAHQDRPRKTVTLRERLRSWRRSSRSGGSSP